MKMTVTPIVTDALGTIPKGLGKGLEDLEISGDHPNYSIIKIGQNTEKSPVEETCCHSNSQWEIIC